MVSDDEILYEIDEVKKRLEKIEEEERKILETERIIMNRTSAVLATEQNVEKRLTKMKFSNITEWRSAIWEQCRYKESRPSEVMITYWCTKLNAPCRFEDCPLNHY